MAMNLMRRCPDELCPCIAGLVLVSASIEAFADQGLPQLLASPVDQVYNAVEAAPRSCFCSQHSALSPIHAIS